MPLPPNKAVASAQARRDLSGLLTELQTRLHDSTDLGRAQAERDHWMLMWDETMQNLLKNMEDIRHEQRLLRQQLESASTAGSTDTDRVIAAIEKLRKPTRQDEPTREPDPWWRFW